MSKPTWHGPTARPDQGPLGEGGSETYVYAFHLARDGDPEAKAEFIARWELPAAEYAARGGRVAVERAVDQQRRAWARLVRTRHLEGSVIVIKTRGFRRSVWQVPMAGSFPT